MLPEFDYVRPVTKEETIGILTEHNPDAQVLAGGTDLLPSMRDRVLRPKILVDIKGIEELHRITCNPESGLTIGANVTFNDIIESEAIKKNCPLLREVAMKVADQEIRNRATLVGNICNASPAADSAPALLVLDARIVAIGPQGERRIDAESLFTGVRRTCLTRDEMVVAVEIPNPMIHSRGKYWKHTRTRGEDLAIVGVCILLSEARNDTMDVRIALASVAPKPVRIREAEKIFTRGGNIDRMIEEAVRTVMTKISPISDVRGSREYRIHMAEFLVRKTLRELIGNQGAS